MGTNYYMITKNKEIKDQYFGDDFELTDHPVWGYEAHVCKISGGWHTLFQARERGFRTVAEIKYLCQREDVQLFDEYSRELTWDEFESILKKHEARTEPPLISHINNRDLGSYHKYFRDPEGYEFSYGDFC